MDELIKTFHIDVKLLIAQVINFAIVVGVLYKFAYKPLLKHMNERSDVIDKGLKDAKEAQENLEKAEKAYNGKLVEAKKEARTILEEAQKQAEKNKQDMVDKAKEETEKVVTQAKTQIQNEKEKMLKEVKQEVGQLVVQVTEKVLTKELDAEAQERISKDALNSIK